ncbi:histidine--tRNA ligase [Myxococcus sp. CA040A]|uniref:Histidine--tRNA ligase n=2 Tax=Myxococcaceae TaxID=31 RepID=A0A540WS05_9BACT|nr:histidine--tRNA ligase [Myxococcus llanfairpwllgwyngyllgogerychwyrndrobwllllantysiliogogogochensis]NTX06735.1 histidine--tRNA ligase [Myxococcus sp. CA040A]TQF11779.1 histidine--tRNA ligase [Myxococcus llanfairpwllgwyngyllgogerychwyrndrobwllllantysiliogogogochensis]
MSQTLSAVKGMNDLLPGEIEIWQHVEGLARELFGRFGYGEIRTPMLEDTALFVRSVGEETDIVGKEMYTFTDKNDRSLSLRPEGTAPAARAYIEHSIVNKEPLTRWFYTGPMFRYERMKTGRYRQFYQIGAEAYGSKEAAQDVEVMDMVAQFLQKLGLQDITLNLNSLGDETCRPAYHAKLVEYLQAHREELCSDCHRRMEKNPLRVLDCKNPTCQAVAAKGPNVLEFLCEPCRAHFDDVQRKLTALDIKFVVNPRMVRGLDYYTRTVFEFIASHPALGTASTVGAGGRYDKLVKSLGGPDVPAVGFACGLDRLVLLLKESQQKFGATPDLFIAVADAGSHDAAFTLASRLRREGLRVDFDTRGGSLKSQMKRSDKSGARFTLVLGELERTSGQAKLKPMAGGEPIPVALDDIARTVRAHSAAPRADAPSAS